MLNTASSYLFFSSIDLPPAEFEQRVKKLVKVNSESGLFECSVCSKLCKKLRSVVDHIKVCHLDGVEHKCKFCPATFKAKTRLYTHVSSRHRGVNKLSQAFDLKQN